MIGKTILHYRILEELGAGGMGEVYKAEDTRLKRQVAIKILPAELAGSQQRLQRFQREAESIASLNHPGIVTIFSVEEAEGLHFLTMELVVGRTLGEMTAEGGFDLTVFFDLALQLARALEAAHDRGVTHRDLKPANIMVTDAGQVKILDFGLAKLRVGGDMADQSQLPTEALTQQGLIMGTIPYMAPEQLEGRITDPRSDVFAMGIILQEMLTGERPFTGENSASLISAILRDDPRPLGAVQTRIPAQLEQVIRRCLEKDPGRRYPTAKELLQDLAEMPTESVSEVATEPRSVAILPLKDMSPQKDQDYFCEGISEDIINALSKIGDLRVASRMASFQVAVKTTDPHEIGQRLDVETVLSGSVRKAGNRVRITAELVKTADGARLWSERYDRELEDVFEVQDEISESIVEALQVTLSAREKQAIQRQSSVDIQAYDYYLRGRSLMNRATKRNLPRALQMFDRAIDIDPEFASAYAGKVDCLMLTYLFFGGDEVLLEQIDEASRKALELAPELAEAHTSRGNALSLQERFAEAEPEYEKAIELDPRLYEAHYFYGRSVWQQGRLEKAVELFERAHDVRPDEYQAISLLSSVYNALDEPDKAREVNRRSMVAIKRHLELYPDDVRALILGATALIGLAEVERGLEWAARAVEMDPEDPGTLYNVACTYAMSGRNEEALDYLERGVAAGISSRDWILNDGDLAALREHPRFQALIDSMS